MPPICKTLGIDEPEFYLEMNPMPNAYTFGDSKIFITVTSGLVEMVSDEELDLNLDEMIANNQSFKTIMADGYVSEEDLKHQAENVVAHLRDLESLCNAEQLSVMKATIAELGVLFATYHYNMLQEFRM